MSMNKLTAERNQRQLLELASKPGNDTCADCKARNPRWASWNLGIFICVSCASIHRKIGTHVTKVKSLTMDQWTKEQVDNMKTTGNLTSNAIYNPNETRHPPPANMMDVERDSELEGYIRSKYEFKRFMHRGPIGGSSSRAPVAGGGSTMGKLGPASTTGASSRSVSSPLAAAPSSSTSTSTSRFTPLTSSTLPPQLPQRPSTVSNLTSSSSVTQPRSVSQPVSTTGPTTAQTQVKKPEGVWADLIGLDAPSGNSTLPLQIAAQSPLTAQHTSFGGGMGMGGMNGMGMGGMNGIGGMGSIQSPYTPAFTSTPTFQLQHMQMPPPTTPGSAGYFQPQPQQQSFQPQAQAGLQIQVPTPGYHQTSFTQNGMMSAPAGQGQYMSTPSPGLVGYMGQTPQPPASTTPTVGFGGAGAGGGFNGSGIGGGGFNGGVPQYAMQGQGMGQFMAPTPPLQVPGMSMFGQQQQQQPQGQFGQSFGGGGMNGMGGQFGQQPQMFGGGGQQWGAL